MPPELLESLPILSELDAFIDLSYAAVAKPDPKAYLMAVDALGLEPRGVLFVDDNEGNVAGAYRAGLEAVHFDITDPPASVRRIRDRLGLSD